MLVVGGYFDRVSAAGGHVEGSERGGPDAVAGGLVALGAVVVEVGGEARAAEAHGKGVDLVVSVAHGDGDDEGCAGCALGREDFGTFQAEWRVFEYGGLGFWGFDSARRGDAVDVDLQGVVFAACFEGLDELEDGLDLFGLTLDREGDFERGRDGGKEDEGDEDGSAERRDHE